MIVLKNEELIKTEGGAIKLGIITAIVVISALVVGIVDGLLRPLSCPSK